MAYFKLAVNPLNDESFKRIVNKPARGIGDTTLAGLATAAQVRQTTLFRAVYLDDIESFGVKPAAVAKLKSFCSMIDSFHTLVPQTDAYELATKIADESGLYASFKADNSIEGQSRVSNIEELVNSVMLFVNEQREQAEDEEALFTLPEPRADMRARCQMEEAAAEAEILAKDSCVVSSNVNPQGTYSNNSVNA